MGIGAGTVALAALGAKLISNFEKRRRKRRKAKKEAQQKQLQDFFDSFDEPMDDRTRHGMYGTSATSDRKNVTVMGEDVRGITAHTQQGATKKTYKPEPEDEVTLEILDNKSDAGADHTDPYDIRGALHKDLRRSVLVSEVLNRKY